MKKVKSRFTPGHPLKIPGVRNYVFSELPMVKKYHR